MKIQASQLNFTIGDVEGNGKKILQALARAKNKGVNLVVFSELALTGYPPEDLLLDHSMIDAAEKKLQEIAPATKGLFVAVGLPRKNPKRKEKPLHNSAAILIDGQLCGFADKILLPTYDVFDERRFFEPGEEPHVFEYLGQRIAVLICEDAWQHAGGVGYTDYFRDPVAYLSGLQKPGPSGPGILHPNSGEDRTSSQIIPRPSGRGSSQQKIDLLLNLSASPYHYKRTDRRLSIFSACARSLQCPVVLCNQVGANDQIVFDGHSFCLNPEGELLQMAKGFTEEDLLIDLSAKPAVKHANDAISDLYSALQLGVRDYFHKQGFTKAILGLSGGIDSALVACIATDALGAQNVQALALPSRFSSSESYTDAVALSKNLNISLTKISIDDLFADYLELLVPHFVGKEADITEENLQTRIRGMILMAFSNKLGALLLNTGNKSEMAMGYTTLYGDMTGALGVLHDVTKTHVYELARFVNRDKEIIPLSIIQKNPSAELRPNQKDEDTLPPFDILDPILEDYLEEHCTLQEIAARRGQLLPFVQEIVQKIHAAEYKRRQAPIGIRVTQKAFSKGRSVPIVQKWR